MQETEPTIRAHALDLLEIPRSIHDQMVAHCLKEAPLECCGILGGAPPRARSIHPLRNAAQSPVLYEADPMDLITAIRSLREHQAEIVAIYHSHPKWAAIPSATDLRLNYYGPVPRVIVSLAGQTPVVRVWELEPETYHELAWRIVDDA